MSDPREKLTPENVARICARVFDQPVERVTAPGGRSRESLRVHFPARTIIATQRAWPGRMRLEMEVLRRLSRQGAPVPAFLGGTEQMFFQADLGPRRLSGELAIAAARGDSTLMLRALESLVAIGEAAQRADLAAIVPPLGDRPEWVAGLVRTVVRTSEMLGIDAPTLDFSALDAALSVPARRFVKWDARPGNASVAADGRVAWFDWEHCGRRQGIEDFAWLAGDEFWPWPPEMVLPALERILPPGSGADLSYLGLFISFHLVQRLTLILGRQARHGWEDRSHALRYDRIGTDPELARRLCRRGAGWAVHHGLTRPMVAWFQDAAGALERLPEPDRPADQPNDRPTDRPTDRPADQPD